MNIATKFTPNKIPTKDVSLEDKYLSDDGTAYMTGIQAMVRLPLAQTRRDTLNGYHTAGFISGYRGSPVGNYDNFLWQVEKARILQVIPPRDLPIDCLKVPLLHLAHVDEL